MGSRAVARVKNLWGWHQNPMPAHARCRPVATRRNAPTGGTSLRARLEHPSSEHQTAGRLPLGFLAHAAVLAAIGQPPVMAPDAGVAVTVLDPGEQLAQTLMRALDGDVLTPDES